jgi:hypothetical protein
MAGQRILFRILLVERALVEIGDYCNHLTHAPRGSRHATILALVWRGCLLSKASLVVLIFGDTDVVE